MFSSVLVGGLGQNVKFCSSLR